MLECFIAVRWSQLLRLNALCCGILVIRKQEVLERTCTHSPPRNSFTYMSLIHRMHAQTQKPTNSPLHSWSSLALALQARVRMQPGSCSVGWGGRGGVGVRGDPSFPSPLVSLLSSSCQRSPHERSAASQQRATSNETQHANVGSVCQERCRLSSLNFTGACSSHVVEGKTDGSGCIRCSYSQLCTFFFLLR